MTFRPLQNVRVVDFSWAAVGPYCTLALASLGAQVIKVGSARQIGGMPARRAAQIHRQVNHSKFSIALDLSTSEGVDMVRRLVQVSDVVVENFRPGVMQRFGLHYEGLVQLRPDIIMVSASSFGQEGPHARYAGFAPVFGAMAGLSSITGLPGGVPTEMRFIMDYTVGMALAYTTLVALYHRHCTGQGQYIDLAGRDVIASTIGEALLDAQLNGRDQLPKGNRDDAWAPHGVYPCKGEDAWVSIAVTTEEEWKALCAALGRPELAQGARYADAYLRRQHQAELDRLLGEWTARCTPWEVTKLLQEHGVAAFPSCSARDLFEDPHLRERQFAHAIGDSSGKSRTIIASPWLVDAQRAPIFRDAPALGQDNELMIGELLGIDPADVHALEEQGVLR